MEILFNIPADIDEKGLLKFDMQSLIRSADELKKNGNRKVRILMIQDYQDATNRQLNYYHGILLKDVIQAHESIGEEITEVEVDKMLRGLFLYQYETKLSTGRKRKIVRSLDKNSSSFPDTKQMSIFFENIVRYYAVNFSFVIYLPNDLTEIDLNFDRLK